MSDKANKILGIALLVFCVVIAVWGVVRQNRRIKTHQFTSGYVYRYAAGGRGNAGGVWIDYVYFVNHKPYRGSSNLPTDRIRILNIPRLMYNRSFPVAYESGNPSNSEMLVIPEDFERFGHLFPDSLRWAERDLLTK